MRTVAEESSHFPDSAAQAAQANLRLTDLETPALIEIDSDGHRSGVRPGDETLLEIGRVLDMERGATLRGVMASVTSRRKTGLSPTPAGWRCRATAAPRNSGSTRATAWYAMRKAARFSISSSPIPTGSTASSPTGMEAAWARFSGW